MSDVVSLPRTADPSQWSDDEKALLDAAGLVLRKRGKQPEPAPRSTVVAFLAHCHRTGLDPIARQIYAIERAGKWTIQVSIDGARLVAQRSGQYAGQTPVEWTGDGKTWVDVWLDDEPPKAARVGVLRRGFEQPLVAVARFSSYAVYVDEWEGQGDSRRKTGKRALNDMWARMPEVMLAKVAEMLALRKAFPLELSGLYSAEEIDFELGAEPTPRAAKAQPVLASGTRSAQRAPLPIEEPTDVEDESDDAAGEDESPVDWGEPAAGDEDQVEAARLAAAAAFADERELVEPPVEMQREARP